MNAAHPSSSSLRVNVQSVGIASGGAHSLVWAFGSFTLNPNRAEFDPKIHLRFG